MGTSTGCRAMAGGIAFALLLGAISLPTVATAVPASLTPLQKLMIKDEIRDKLTLYVLYADGDGPSGTPRNVRKLAETLMTPDVVSEIYLADGSPAKVLKGREIVANSPSEVDPLRARRFGGRHYIVSTVFDDVTATTVRTRSPAVYFAATKHQPSTDCDKAEPGSCGQRSVTTIMWVYHMTWKKTPQGWQIAHNTLRDDN